MVQLDQKIIESLLSRVQKPGRYMGRELNVIVKHDARLRMALSYPDLYEVGMSNNGLRILYDIVNAIPGAACERVFAVEADFENALREAGVPLFTLETYTPLHELDLVGFNVSHELLCTNVLQILDLGGIPLRRADREEGAPIVIAGGEAVSNPFPLADFIDVFFVGDGEEGIAEIAHAVLAAKAEGLGRRETLERISRVEGVLLPGRYTFSYDGCAVSKAEGPPVRKRVYRGLGLTDPVRPLVPNIRIAQERIVIELTRGCSNFCNFCHAGFYDLPYRCYDFNAAAERIDKIVRNTGYNEVTLSSLSISDYPKLTGLINRVLPGLTERGISVAFPSLRVDRETLPVIEQISEVRRASLTFAVESASDAIRARANKKVVLQDLIDIVKHVYGRGWKVIKLYFMIGLPGCEEQDEAEGIIELLKHIFTIGGKRMDINVTVSPFVPKPHTPFQRERQMGRDYFESTVLRIKRGLPRSIKIKNHDVKASIIEGVLTRGDARLGAVIERSYSEGCRFDSWEEHFSFDIWRKNLDELLPGWEACLGRKDERLLPWSFAVTGFEGMTERLAGSEAREVGRRERPHREGDEIDAARIQEARKAFEQRFSVMKRVRLCLAKTGMMRFIPHNDFMEIVKRALRMADAPVAMTQGFNKRERMSAGFPLPLGIESEAELVDIELFDDIDDGLLERLNGSLPGGISASGIGFIDEWVSIMALTGVVEYRVTDMTGDTIGTMARGLGAGVEFIKRTGKGEKRLTGTEVVHSHALVDDRTLLLRLYTGSEQSVRIDDAVRNLASIDGPLPVDIRIMKTAQYRKTEGGIEVIR